MPGTHAVEMVPITELERIKGLNTQLAKALRAAEWVEPCDDCEQGFGRFCADSKECGAWEKDGHLPSCRIPAALAAAKEG